MEMHVEPEGAIGSLHKRERAYLGITNRAQAKLSLRAPTQRTLQRIGESAENIGTKSSVIAQGAAKSPASSTKGASRPIDGSGPRGGRHRPGARRCPTCGEPGRTGRNPACKRNPPPSRDRIRGTRAARGRTPESRIARRTLPPRTSADRPALRRTRGIAASAQLTSACRSVSSGRRGA
jgi:hypothetical protein